MNLLSGPEPNVGFWADCVAKVFWSHRSQNFRAVGAASDRILMWGTTSFCDELTDDIGGMFEATSIDGCCLFCHLAEILPHGVLGVLQQNRLQSAKCRDVETPP